jgi:hypothetical protein
MNTKKSHPRPAPVVPDLGGYITATDVGRMLGVTTERVRQLAGRPDNPIPSLVTPLGRLFWPDDVTTWQTARAAAGYVHPAPGTSTRTPGRGTARVVEINRRA